MNSNDISFNTSLQVELLVKLVHQAWVFPLQLLDVLHQISLVTPAQTLDVLHKEDELLKSGGRVRHGVGVRIWFRFQAGVWG